MSTNYVYNFVSENTIFHFWTVGKSHGRPQQMRVLNLLIITEQGRLRSLRHRCLDKRSRQPFGLGVYFSYKDMIMKSQQGYWKDKLNTNTSWAILSVFLKDFARLVSFSLHWLPAYSVNTGIVHAHSDRNWLITSRGSWQKAPVKVHVDQATVPLIFWSTNWVLLPERAGKWLPYFPLSSLLPAPLPEKKKHNQEMGSWREITVARSPRRCSWAVADILLIFSRLVGQSDWRISKRRRLSGY